MTTITTLFPSTSLNADYIEVMARETAANEYKEILPEKCGYVLVNKRLVPYPFLDRLKTELDGINFQYGFVLNERVLFKDAFLKTLDSDEREVLMPCVLILIERGDFEVNLFESTDE